MGALVGIESAGDFPSGLRFPFGGVNQSAKKVRYLLERTAATDPVT